MQHYLHQCRLPAECLSIDIGARLQQDSNSRQEVLTENEDKNICEEIHKSSDCLISV